MKKKGLAQVLFIPLIFLSACGSLSGGADFADNLSKSNYAVSEASYDDYDYAEDEELYYDGDYEYEVGATITTSENVSYDSTGNSSAVNREMLVYRCDLSIDTLDFEGAVSSFKNLVREYDGFIESENFGDSGSFSNYYVEVSDRHYSYSSTVRIPSSKYEQFLSNTEGIGDVRSKSSYTENVAPEYGTAKSTLEICEAEYQRYLDMLSDTYDDEVAFSIQQELTELAIRIAELKSRMASLESDVAYSYINVTIRAVERYSPNPVKSSFNDRLSEVMNESLETFLGFLEGVLFTIIMCWWYIAIIALIILIIVLIVRHSSKKKQKQMMAASYYPYLPAGQNVPTQNAPAQNAPAQNAPAQNAPAQNAPAQNAPAQNAPDQNATAQNICDQKK